MYEVNNTKFVLIQFVQAISHHKLCYCWFVHYS